MEKGRTELVSKFRDQMASFYLQNIRLNSLGGSQVELVENLCFTDFSTNTNQHQRGTQVMNKKIAKRNLSSRFKGIRSFN